MKDYPESPPYPPLNPPANGNGKTGGMIGVKHRKLGALIARGAPLTLAAEEAGLSPSRAYHLLADKDSFVNAEVERISNEIFQAQDALLSNLYRTALEELEALLLSGNPRIVLRAVDLIIRIFLERTGNIESPVIQQLFGCEPNGHQNGIGPSMDDWILEMARERQSKAKG
jgi:AcrR family transcriptional regulator